MATAMGTNIPKSAIEPVISDNKNLPKSPRVRGGAELMQADCVTTSDIFLANPPHPPLELGYGIYDPSVSGKAVQLQALVEFLLRSACRFEEAF